MKKIVNEDFARQMSLPIYSPKAVDVEDDHNPRLDPPAVPLHKMLVSAQIDGVSIENAPLLQRQYDEEFGQVDPASDIHTDVHVLQDALMRQARNNKVATAMKTKQETTE